MTETERYYRCSDLHLCAYLRAKYQLPVVNAVRNPHTGRVSFIFDLQGHDLTEIRQEYFTNHAEVNVRAFCDELRYLKTMIFDSTFPMNGNDEEIVEHT
jgi:hypothetical protein